MNIFDTIKENGSTPTKVDEDTYWYALEVLPPIYAKGCFGMGEQYSFSPDGQPTYYWFTSRKTHAPDAEFYGIIATKAQAEAILNAI